MSIAFVQARHYTPGRIKPIRFLVIHDMEYPERLDTAERVAAWFAGPNAPRASTHYNIDADSVVQSVRDGDTAWCAPGANADGLHFEHAGYARQTRAEWLDDYGRRMLDRSARLVAAKCIQHKIPAVKRGPADILAGRPGVVGHWDVTKAYPDKGSHTDPGSSFPWDWYMPRVASYANPPKPVPYPGHQHWISGPDDRHVGMIQKRLKALGLYAGAIDNSFGPATRAAVVAFQKKKRLEPDGYVGPKTWAALEIRA